MSAITEKYNCGNCDFWLEDPTLSPSAGAALVMHDSGKPRAPRLGHCRMDPPTMVMIPVAHPMNPQMMQMKMQRHYPITQPDEICSHHPILKADTLRGMVALSIRAYLDMLDYKPGKYPDETAAGFSRIPTLDEAKRMAQGANANPGEPVPPEQVSS